MYGINNPKILCTPFPPQYNRHMNKIEGQKLKILIGFVLTLLIIHFVPHDIVLSPAILLVFWTILFWPWHTSERIMFAIAAVFFFAQNYSVLAMGGFTFKHQDFFLMPSYEPFLWGFYFLSMFFHLMP